ncbi:ThuA domain-containing protein [Paenibacillus harenae]|uniref:ThuA domain-containing protein n=1 Tax=Paenibacillus harenae TaxID=306543 RepID=UPI002790D588|nr:ThuA domain-containing protein [Paenibacillus harenae]MDQ0061057.1 type 1 glutamine amidotransferase [Paenibacillus harenae]
MSGLIRTLVFGDNERAPYHPLHAIEKELRAIIGEGFHMEMTDDYERLHKESIEQYDLCISYADCWEEKLTDAQVAGLLAFVAEGGGLLVIHNGISVQNRHELRQLIGAKFLGHPAYRRLTFQYADTRHVMVEGAEPFEMDEEPYRFEMDSFIDTELLMTYTIDGKSYPAAWAHKYGLGRVAYLMPGHHAPSFALPAYRSLIKSAAKWAAGACE